MSFFPDIAKIKYEGPDSQEPARLPPLQRGREGRRQVDEGASALRRVLLAHLPRHRQRSVRPRLRRAAVGGRHRLASRWRLKRGRRSPLSSWRSSACPSIASTIATWRPKARRSRETNTTSTRSSRCSRKSSSGPGIKLLWGTANLFSNPRYMHGAATSCNADAFAYAAPR